MKATIRTLLGVVLLVLSTGLLAQAYPVRPVRIVVPFPPGGSVDLIARVLAQRLSEQMGQQFIVENRTGAGGALGSDAVAKAAPDGYTLLVQASTLVTGPLLVSSVPYDAVRDFTAVSLIGSVPLIMTVHPSVPAANLREFIAHQRADPKRYTFATSPVGSAGYFATEAIRHEAKLDILIVPYKGTAAAIADLLGGQVSALIDAIPSSYPLAKSGKLKLIAVTSAQRLALAPDVLTVAESGLPGFEMESWYGLWGPAKMPKELAARLAAEVAKAMRSQLATERLSDQGFKAAGSMPEQFSEYIVKEVARHARLVNEAKIKPQ
jgi:tripartite-type tricarboxylate transporter receptor subunit TctC